MSSFPDSQQCPTALDRGFLLTPESSQRRYSVLPNSLRLSILFDQSVSVPRPKRRSRSSLVASASLTTCKRTSFIDMDCEHPKPLDNGLLDSIRGRLAKKRLAPLFTGLSPDPGPSAADRSLALRELAFPRLSALCPRNSSVCQAICGDLTPSRSRRLSGDQGYKHVYIGFPETILDDIESDFTAKRPARSPGSTTKNYEVDAANDEFRLLSLKRSGAELLHPYPRSGVPYVQAYNRVILQNEIYFNLLLRRLNTNGSPSFHDYLCPPQSVLDLGCGIGSWITEAATAWASLGTTVTGFDLFDLVGQKAEKFPNLRVERGNFLAKRLPFDSGTFDLVRMANLTEAIDRWEDVLREVWRVLKPQGRVEIIDDEFIFAYPKLIRKLKSQSARSSWSSSNTARSGSDISCTTRSSRDSSSSFLDLIADKDSIISTPSLYRDDSPSSESSDYLLTPTAETFFDFNNTSDRAQYTSSDLLCQDVEKIFESMLTKEYGINTRPGASMESLLQKVFGPASRAKILKDFTLSTLDPVIHDFVHLSKTVQDGRGATRKGRNLFRLNDESRSADQLKGIMERLEITSQQNNSKARRILGAEEMSPLPPVITLSNQVPSLSLEEMDLFDESAYLKSHVHTMSVPIGSTSPESPSTSRRPLEPLGLFLFPDQFLETTSWELEMYLLKHVHTLLGSKAALDDYVQHTLTREDSQPLASPEDWSDVLSEYERSCRRRFDLLESDGISEEDDNEDERPRNPLDQPFRPPYTIVPRVAAAINKEWTSNKISSHSRPHTPVRRIRVFEAYKVV